MISSKDASPSGHVTIPKEDKQPNEIAAVSTNAPARAEAQAVVVPEANASQGLDFLMNDLTWEDDYYANEEDIVAVFDMDAEAYVAYKRRLASKPTAITIVLCSLTLLFAIIKIYWLAFVFGACTGCFFVLAAAPIVKACKVARGMHLALTSTTLRFDVEQSVSQQTPIRNIVSCTTTEFKLDFVGGKMPLAYPGLKSPENFQKVLAQLQRRQQA